MSSRNRGGSRAPTNERELAAWYGKLPHFGKEYSLERFRRFEVLCRCIEEGKYPYKDTSVAGYGPAQQVSEHCVPAFSSNGVSFNCVSHNCVPNDSNNMITGTSD